MPPFLRRYQPVEFSSPQDEIAFKRLTAGILGIAPIQVEDYIQSQHERSHLPLPPGGGFSQGHALVIGVAHYARVNNLPEAIQHDASDLKDVLTDAAICGYRPENVSLLLDDHATRQRITAALAALARQTEPDSTAVVYFSGHGYYQPGSAGQSCLLCHDSDPRDPTTVIQGEEMTAWLQAIQAGRLLVILDSCHSEGAGDPKGQELGTWKTGLPDRYYQQLAVGRGRVVLAACRQDEASWALKGMRNSLFTHYLLEALHGSARTLGDGYIRIFDIFRHVADLVPTRADQHPVFKASALQDDFPVALGYKH